MAYFYPCICYHGYRHTSGTRARPEYPGKGHLYPHDDFLNLPFGTSISNFAPFPGSPVSVMVIPVISQELTNKEQAKTGSRTKAEFEYFFFFIERNSLAIILIDQE